MCQQYVCPECFGYYERKRRVRIKRRDGDHLEVWPSVCWLCNEGHVTLDEIVERATDPLLYFERLFAPALPTTTADTDAAAIPFNW